MYGTYAVIEAEYIPHLMLPNFFSGCLLFLSAYSEILLAFYGLSWSPLQLLYIGIIQELLFPELHILLLKHQYQKSRLTDYLALG